MRRILAIVIAASFLLTAIGFADTPCGDVVCKARIIKCSDGLVNICDDICINGACEPCTVDCTGHGTPQTISQTQPQPQQQTQPQPQQPASQPTQQPVSQPSQQPARTEVITGMATGEAVLISDELLYSVIIILLIIVAFIYYFLYMKRKGKKSQI